MSPKFFHITTWFGYSIPSRLQFFNKISCQKFTSAITVADATTIHIFGYSTISKSLPINLIKTFIKFSQHHEYKFYNFRIGKVGELYWSEYFMQICFDHEIIVKTTGGYASSMNGKVEHNPQTINNAVHIKILPLGHNNDPWCFCYQYTIFLIYCPINMWLGTPPIFSWYKTKNIYYNTPFSELVIWGWEFYIINYKQGKKELDQSLTHILATIILT